jgi:hypothetical protein
MQPARSPRTWAFAVALVAAVVAATAVLLVSGGDDGAEETIRDTSAPAGEFPPRLEEGEEATEGGGGGGTERENDEEAVVRAAADYLEGIDDRDGGRVCAVLAPGAIQGFEVPRERGGCAASLGASIGYRDPRGFPVFDRARVESIQDVAVGASQARVTATVVTEFADRKQPSIEEDLIYLVDIDDEWRVAKPSSTLYRAVGKPEVPPEAIAPPD